MTIVGAVAVEAADPAPVFLIRRAGRLPQSWYREQADLLQQQLAIRPDDPVGWYSLFVATEYADSGQDTLQTVLSQMARNVADIWQLPYLQARVTRRPDRVALLQEALSRCADCGEVLEDLAMERELSLDLVQADALWQRLHDSATLAPGLLDYNYNLLQSVADAAILITGGYNDTLPAWMLQSTRGVRPDVLVLNLFLADSVRGYLQGTLRAHGADTRGPLASRLRLTGLAARLGPAAPGELQHNMQRRFRLDSLSHDWYADAHISTRPLVRRLNGNYAYPLVALAQGLDASDPMAARRCRDLAERVAVDSGDAHLLEHVQARLGDP
jgi:hypothetical protein